MYNLYVKIQIEEEGQVGPGFPKGKKRRKQSQETINKIRTSKIGFTHTEESKEKTKQSIKLLYQNGYISPNKGRKHSAETKEKIKQSMLRKKYASK
jgi:hypothetical protein